MNPTIISILLWIPFCISLLVCGLILCIKGYRKGLVRAAIGLAATVAATALALLLGNLLASLFSTGGTQNAASIVLSVIKRPILSLFFFWLLTPVLTIIFRCVASKIMKDRFMPQQTWQKVLGMVVGLVCAVTFSLFWLSPLYGSVAMAGDLAEAMLTTADSNDPQTQQLLKAAASHPVVAVSKAGPVDWVYRGTARIGSGVRSFSVSSMLESTEKCLELITQIDSCEDREQIKEKATELVTYIHTDVASEPWFYHLYKTLLSQVKKTLEALEKAPVAETFTMCEVILDEDGDGYGYYANYYMDAQGNLVAPVMDMYGNVVEKMPVGEVFVDEDDDGDGIYVNPQELDYVVVDYNTTAGTAGSAALFSGTVGKVSVPAYVKELLPLYLETVNALDVDQQTFAENMDNLFGFLAHAMEAGLWDILEEGNLQAAYKAGIVADAGKLANSSPEAVAVKRFVILTYLLDATEDYGGSATEILDICDFSQITDADKQTQEAALLLGIFLGEDYTLGEFLAGYPGLGADAFFTMTEKYGLARACELDLYQQNILDKLMQADPNLEAYILESCRETTGDAAAPTARECCLALCYVITLCDQAEGNISDPSAAAVAFAVDYFGVETPVLEQARLAGEIMYRVLQAYPEALAGYEGQEEEYVCNMYWIAWLLDYMLEQQESGLSEYGYYELLNYTSWYIDRDIPTTVVKYIVDTKGSNPLQIRQLFDRDTAAQFKQDLEFFPEWHDPTDDYKQAMHLEYTYTEVDGKLYLENDEGIRYEVSDYEDYPEELLPSEEWVEEQKALIRERVQYLIKFLGF